MSRISGPKVLFGSDTSAKADVTTQKGKKYEP